jgi:hypothetical protein
MLRHFKTTSRPLSRTASPEYSRILSAAVINSSFRQMLLKDPVKAVSGGYSGEKFDLNNDDKSMLASIRAASLAEFAAQLSNI